MLLGKKQEDHKLRTWRFREGHEYTADQHIYEKSMKKKIIRFFFFFGSSFVAYLFICLYALHELAVFYTITWNLFCSSMIFISLNQIWQMWSHSVCLFSYLLEMGLFHISCFALLLYSVGFGWFLLYTVSLYVLSVKLFIRVSVLGCLVFSDFVFKLLFTCAVF